MKDIEIVLLNDEHAEQLFNLVDRNRSHLSPWFGWVKYMTSTDSFRNFITASKQRMEDGAEISYVIFYKGELAGRIGIYYIDKANRSGGIGYWLGKEYVGKGIVSSCIPEILSAGFNDLHLNRIEIKCATDNARSKAVPERFSFYYEGIMREAEMHEKGFKDLHLFSMLKKEHTT
jgi:ribosomal-protein-serine acetyltransferase